MLIQLPHSTQPVKMLIFHVHRTRIVKENGVSMVEHYCFEEHEDLKRAAMECMCNLVMNETVGVLLFV